MIRTQIQLTEEQARRLKRLAAARGRSMADLIRTSVDDLLTREEGTDEETTRQRARAVSGRFRSGMGDLATRHDRHLAEVLGK